MILRTEIELRPASFKIGIGSKIITIGSCFSEVIGSQLSENKIDTLCNPYGTVFNPASIFKLINHSLQNQAVFKHLFLQNDDIWQHYDFHSKFFAKTKEELENTLNHTHQQVNQFLKKANVLIITLGSAWVHQLKENSQIVSNCHKSPGHLFKKELLTIKEILMRFRTMHESLKLQNPKIKIILTVSPVRHTKETLSLNSLSKSILRTACHELEQEFEDVHYFPSYEIMIDDLRDYRFYADDLIHPNAMAEKYIFDKFGEVYFEGNFLEFLKEWGQIRASLSHRPLHEKSASQRIFLEKLLDKLLNISTKVEVQEEINTVRTRLEKFTD